ncbi:hypothetical protein VP01_2727g4 [Puccinia sorghi]|uniref:Uncharacterized protein n=1 Tax=Puccinia sorghi TaxID=27349 RepID=A0A0L6V541_9BASI|nr:hypothetical protein VP01_2727g4 [Puccinia sorghi]
MLHLTSRRRQCRIRIYTIILLIDAWDHPDAAISPNSMSFMNSDGSAVGNTLLTETSPKSHSFPKWTGASSISPSYPSFTAPDLAAAVIQDEDEESLLFPSAPLLQEYHSPALQALSTITNWSSSDSSNLISLRLDHCNLKNKQLDTLAHGICISKLKHVVELI